MEMVRRCKNIENAQGHNDFWKHCQSFFGENNFSHQEIMGIMHHINSCYFMGMIPADNAQEMDTKCTYPDDMHKKHGNFDIWKS